MGGTTTSFERGNYRRACDDCGTLWNRSDLRKMADGKTRCKQCWNLIPAIVLDGRSANSPKLQVRPVPNAKPHDAISVATDIEGRMFNVLDEVAPYRYYDVTGGKTGGPVGSKSIEAAAETIRAFYNIVAENKRQTVVISRAKLRIAALADWLLTQQYGNAAAASGYAAVSTATEYGAFTTSADPTTATVYSYDVGAAGLALVYAYQVTGDGRYKLGYQAALKCLRRLQCGDLHTDNFTTTSSQGTTPLHLGMWTHSLRVGCVGGPVGISTRYPTPSAIVAGFTGTATITFASAVTVSAWATTFNGTLLTTTPTPGLGNSSASWSGALTGAVGGGLLGFDSWSTTMTVDAASTCKQQTVSWSWLTPVGVGGGGT